MNLSFFVAVLFIIFPPISAITYTVTVGLGGNPQYNPVQLTAVPFDIVKFVFYTGNHSVTQSTFDSPCTPLQGGFDSGMIFVEGETNLLPSYHVHINDTNPIWIHSRQMGVCEQGRMVFAINIPGGLDIRSFTNFQGNARNNGSSTDRAFVASSSTSTSSSQILTPDPTPTFYGPTDHLIIVGADNQRTFSPSNIKAAVGDTVTFEFRPKNHSVIQSSYLNPCRPLEDTDGIIGLKPGFVPLPDGTTSFPQFQIIIVNTRPIWGYCGQVGHCEAGMLFAINALDSGEISFAGFVQRAMLLNGTASVTQYPYPQKTYANSTLINISRGLLHMSIGTSLLVVFLLGFL
ncbi:hypothetical protein BDQ12DRAFT_612254 [Crucibulum laeve]|uniref:Cupredoxin n=1 Tax=Crucibulum laeve TaxID=68775 RepID=A0A5C3LS32_9AGAR|nr:hypothetical protein BDQ12DRAFT_612254 [Crucibulum laeve]